MVDKKIVEYLLNNRERKNYETLFKKINLNFIDIKDIVFRAVENRVFIAISSSSGPTFYVNKYGKVIEELEFYKNGVLKFSI